MRMREEDSVSLPPSARRNLHTEQTEGGSGTDSAQRGAVRWTEGRRTEGRTAKASKCEKGDRERERERERERREDKKGENPKRFLLTSFPLGCRVSLGWAGMDAREQNFKQHRQSMAKTGIKMNAETKCQNVILSA